MSHFLFGLKVLNYFSLLVIVFLGKGYLGVLVLLGVIKGSNSEIDFNKIPASYFKL